MKNYMTDGSPEEPNLPPESAYTNSQRDGYPMFGSAVTTNHIRSRSHAEMQDNPDPKQGLNRREKMDSCCVNDQFPWL